MSIAIFAYPRWGIFPLAFIILPFLLDALYSLRSKWDAVRLGLIASMIAGYGGYTWITYVLSEMGDLPIMITLLMHTGFNIICIPNYNSFFFFGFFLRESVEKLPLYLRPLFWASFWTVNEFLFRFIKIFPEMIGNTLWPWLSVSQIVSFGGTSATSFIVAFVGASFFYIARDYHNKKAYASLALSLGLVIAAHFWGAARIDRLKELPTQSVKVAMVQANIANANKAIAFAGVRKGLKNIIRDYKDMTALAAQTKPDIILWPETAYPMSYPVSPDSQSSSLSRMEADFLQRQARTLGHALLIGTYERAHNKEHNAVVLIDENGVPQTSYKKSHLLIFGEYMPFSDWFPVLKKLNPQLGDFGRGRGPYPIIWDRKDKPPLRMGVNICYEALIMNYMRELARNGAEVFINFSNDSWFGPGNEPYQHLMVTAHRIIENGIPMIRSTNTGITGFIDVTGELVKSGPLFQPKIVEMDFPIPLQPVETFYRAHGELLAWILTFLTLGAAGCLYIRHALTDRLEAL